MLDTKGPEYRIRTFRNGKVFLHDGDDFTFTTEDIIGDEHIVSVNFKQLMENLEIGDTILVNNGLVIFKVVSLSSSRAKCKVIVGGELSNSKSIQNLMHSRIMCSRMHQIVYRYKSKISTSHLVAPQEHL